MTVTVSPGSGLNVVAALNGTEYAAIFLLVAVFSAFAPRVLHEVSDRRGILLKFAGIALIGVGFIALARV